MKVERKQIRQDYHKRTLGSTRTEHIKGWLPMWMKNPFKISVEYSVPRISIPFRPLHPFEMLSYVNHTKYVNHGIIEHIVVV